MTSGLPNLLVVDDQEPILHNFATLLEPSRTSGNTSELDLLELALGGTAPAEPVITPRYHVRYARQGAEAVRECEAALAADRPFSVAFVDIHMPPGIDGVETAMQLWQLQPDLEIVLCTAHSTYSWHEILARLSVRDQLVILRKPFDPIEVRQLAACLTEKWRRGRAVAARMAELEQEIAREVARRLEIELRGSQKFEALGRLAAGIAHEINTPSQFIQSSLEFLGETFAELDGPPSADCRADIATAISDAVSGVSRITSIVRSVREYAHTSGEQHEPVDLNRQVRMAGELARSQYKHDAELVLDLGDVPAVMGHADELGRAILNLLVNAAHAIRARKDRRLGTITIKTRCTDRAVELAISDTGVGIAPEARDRIFEPFFTTKALGEGTGQGLAIVRATIVDRHQGTMRFESELGHGTTFMLTLPLPSRAPER
ncbi:MAG: ATP-binding protein [Kofleriaceae bacterium]